MRDRLMPALSRPSTLSSGPNGKRLLAMSLVFVCLSVGVSNCEVRGQRAVWTATPVNQTNGTTVKMPLKRNVSRSSGLNLTVDTRWSQNYGYRPIEVTVSSPVAATVDRRVFIELHTGWNGPIVVEQELTLPKGSLTASAKMDVPQYQMATPFYYWDVWVDDIKDKDLSLEQDLAWSVMQSGYAASSGKMFLTMGTAIGQRSLVAPSTMEFEVLSLAASEFPQRWIEYTCFDVVTLSMSELRTLSQQNPAAFRAVMRWLHAGGQLWVNDAGDEYEHVNELSKLVRLPGKVDLSPDTNAKDASTGLTVQFSIGTGWKPAHFSKGNTEGQVATFLNHATGAVQTVRDPDAIAKLENDPNYTLTGRRFETAGENPGTITATNSGEWFVEQRLGLGNVRAFRQTNDVSLYVKSQSGVVANAANAPQGGDPGQMPPSLTAALQTTGRWSVRHGVLPDDQSIEFANLLVPGVGMAPVREFQVLITLFVIVIGPLNYWLLKRWKRLHLIILTVPLAAAVITLGLFAYAIASDGFETKVRSHSLTMLDQRTGEASCWSRLSYYSGLAPGGGLTMPADVAMFPIIPSWNEYSAQSYVRGERGLRWDGENARLTRGWLRSRTPMQYLTIRSRKSPIKLEVTPVRDRLRVKNELGAQLTFVAVVDDSGKFWSGEELKVGEVTFLQPTKKADAASRFRKFVTTNAPQVPSALSGDNSRYASIQRQQWRRYGQYTAFAGEQSLAANLANEAVISLAGLTGGEELGLPPRSYIAVTATGPEVLYGMDGVEEEASFHVLVGQW